MLTVYCRMCLNPSQFNEIVSLFDTYKGFCIRDAVLELFQIKILPTEMLSNICKKCVAMVCTVRDIREEFIAQNLKYQQMISNSSKEESNATQPQHAVKQSPLAAEPSPEVESTTEQQLDQGETCESVESLELMEVKDTIASDNGDSNSIICFVEQLDTDGQDMSQSEIEVKLVPGNSGKSPVRFEIATTRDDYDSEEVDVLEAKNNGNNATSVQEYCAYSEDSSEPTVVHSEKGTISYTSMYVCEWCELYFGSERAYMEHVCPKRFEATQAQKSQRKKKRIEGKSNKKVTKKEKKQADCSFGTSVICPHCSDVFDEDKQLLQHGQEKHPELFQIIQCNECTEEFGTTEALNKHVWLRHRTGYQCKFCEKKLPTAYALQSHENVHTKRQTFCCSVCNKMFSQYTSMWRHMQIHNDIKAYECDLCQRRFRQRTVMLAHRLVHTGEKPYTCELCDKSFRDRSTLARHGQVHAKEKTSKRKQNMESTAD